MLLEEDLTYQVRGAVFEVSRRLGHGFLEKVYERALICELRSRGIEVASQVSLVVRYKGEAVGWYYADMIVEDRIVVELKARTRTASDEAQLLNYRRASGLRVGMLVNFVYPRAQLKRLIR